MGEALVQRRVSAGIRSPVGDQPRRLDLESRSGPSGVVDLSFRRADGSLADCGVVGITRLVLSAQRVGLSQPVRFEVACGEELPDWSRLMSHPGRLDLLAEGDQDGRIFYRGTWQLQLVPDEPPPALVLELL